ncbi:MAG TPA: CdaR family protein [bacterium]|nr:CdaR family protein [bacterium]
MQFPVFLRRLRRFTAARRLDPQFLRALVTRNLTLKLVALLLATLMWAFVALQKRGDTTELKFFSPLVFTNIPANMEVAAVPVQSVSVLVRAPRRVAESLNPGQFQVAVDLRSQAPGTIDYDLTERNLSYNGGTPPEGIQVLQVSPSRIPIRLEATLQRQLPIEVRVAGELTEGYRLAATQVTPPVAQVAGPQAVVERLHSIETRPLDVQDLHASVEMLASLDLPAGVRLVGGKTQFRAHLTVVGHADHVVLNDIPVVFDNASHAYKVSATSLNVHVEGPPDVIDGLQKDKVFAVIDLSKYPPGDYRGVVPKVVLPPRVRVLEQWPIVNLYVYKRKLRTDSG